jgi:hypothetical protein
MSQLGNVVELLPLVQADRIEIGRRVEAEIHALSHTAKTDGDDAA